MKVASTLALVLSLASTFAIADEVVLRGGGKVSGIIVERTPDAIVLETPPGRVSIPLFRVLSVRSGESDLAAYHDRAARLGPGDVAGWVKLARWAADHDLVTAAREAYLRVLELDPTSAEANEGLGRVRHDGHWMSSDEAHRAQGLVPFEGGWVTSAEREAIHRERANESAEALSARQAEARAREAEARAREAEARASAAERDAAQAGDDADRGIPLAPYGYGGVYGPVDGSRRPHRPPRHPPATQPPAPAPPPPPTTSRMGPTRDSPPKPVKGGNVADPKDPR